jgi:hypothetical protein
MCADRGDLDHMAVFQHRQNRAESAGRKIHVSNPFAGFVEYFLERERDGCESPCDAVEVGARQGGEQRA